MTRADRLAGRVRESQTCEVYVATLDAGFYWRQVMSFECTAQIDARVREPCRVASWLRVRQWLLDPIEEVLRGTG